MNKRGRLDGRVALVIGAARGIGFGIASRFAEEGARVMIADRDAGAGTAAADRLGGSAVAQFVAIDIGQKDGAAQAVTETERLIGPLDILIQNAGIYPWTMIENIEPEEWDQVLAVNLRGTFLAARAAFLVMKARGRGRMVFTSSITGPRVTSPGHGHYSASKAGINGFRGRARVRALRDHCKRHRTGKHRLKASWLTVPRISSAHGGGCRWVVLALRISPTRRVLARRGRLHYRYDNHRWRPDASRASFRLKPNDPQASR
jgi:NADP-dependent 3-hydroxy acid dehydrogenase YdfG